MSSPQVNRAINLACTAHHGQFRKGGHCDVPYIAHPFAVATLVLQFTDDEDCFVAALLHDVIEDCAPVYVHQLNPRIISTDSYGIICALTDKKPKGVSYRDRKMAFIVQIIAAGPKAILVSACDKIHNMQSLLENLRLNRETGTRPIVDLIWYWETFIDRSIVPIGVAVLYRNTLAELCHWAHDELAKACLGSPE